MKTDMLIQEVREALAEIDQALGQGTFSVAQEGYPTTEELVTIRGQLQKVETELANSRVPQRAQRSLWIGRIVTDGWWQYKEPLARKLLTISDAYLRKLP